MGGERVPQEMGMDTPRLEPGLRRQPAQDQKRAGPGERPALGIEEQLGPVATVEVGTAAREVAPERFGALTADRHDPLLRALAEATDEAAVEIDAALVERHGLRHAQARAVQEFDERAVAQVTRLRAGSRVDQALGFSRRERPGQLPPAAGQVEVGAGIVVARAEQLLMAEERTHGGGAPRDRRGRESGRAELGEVALEVLSGRGRRRGAEEARDVREIAPVRVDGPRRAAGREEGKEALDVRTEGARDHAASHATEPLF